MNTNEGVGKKIVEALKKQSGAEIEFTPNLADEVETQDVAEEPSFGFANEDVNDNAVSNDIEFTEVEEEVNESAPVQDSSFEIKEQQQPKFEAFQQSVQTNNSFGGENFQSSWNFEEKQEFRPSFQETQQYTTQPKAQAKQFEMPPNVSVLKKLITQLPTGVTKQTGAQIIKQTMEALGISMNTVLHEAQKVQDDMNDSIKNCMLTIQEYKNNIKNLEKQGLDYQRQVNQLNDLISLFILSDKD